MKIFEDILNWVNIGAAFLTASSSVDSYIAKESSIAKTRLLANIGPDGATCHGAKSGIVIASPSTYDPDYVYTWTRDASLVFKTLVDQYTSGQDTSLRGLIDDFVAAQATLQKIDNPSGPGPSGGLGEPKFHIDETAFTDPWGRPQRDGPALRAITIIGYANWLVEHDNSSWVTEYLWPVIKLDLDYVASNWNQSTFDLWEEVESASFFTTAVQHRALREGVALSSKISQTSVSASYGVEAEKLLCFLQSYWNPTGGYVTSNTGGGRSGKDSNSVLTSIHTFDPAAGCDATIFQPCSDKALSNLKVYVDSFREIYVINNGISNKSAVAVGRYAEDIYYNGNPWYLSGFAVAEQLYDAIIVWNAQGSLSVTPTSLSFFRQFAEDIELGTYASSTSTFKHLTSAIKTFADGFIEVNAKYTPADGSLAEQFHRNDGTPLSAKDLTWSYAAALAAFAARRGFTATSWGAKGLSLPLGCSNVDAGGPQRPLAALHESRQKAWHDDEL